MSFWAEIDVEILCLRSPSNVCVCVCTLLSVSYFHFHLFPRRLCSHQLLQHIPGIGDSMEIFSMNKFRFWCWAYLCCAWLAHPEPYNRLWQPCNIPPSGNESSPALVSGCRCGCGLRWAELAGLASLWCPAAGAGRVKEPRLEYQAPCVSTKTEKTNIISIITGQGVKEQRCI